MAKAKIVKACLRDRHTGGRRRALESKFNYLWNMGKVGNLIDFTAGMYEL